MAPTAAGRDGCLVAAVRADSLLQQRTCTANVAECRDVVDGIYCTNDSTTSKRESFSLSLTMMETTLSSQAPPRYHRVFACRIP
jgi:hypothetical protein